MSFTHRRIRVLHLLVIAACGAIACRAAEKDLLQDAVESIQNVTVNDSPEARKDIDTAHDLERQKEWVKAAGWYQGVLEKYHGRVTAWRANDQKVIDHYRGIVYEVQQSLAQWPAEGVEAYRSRYDLTAAQLLNTGPDNADVLNHVLQTYFLTESAKTAGLRLIDLHMEAGEFDAAAEVGELLLNSYPAAHLVAERPRLLFRTALAEHFSGNEKAAAKRAEELGQKFTDAVGTIFGKDVNLSKSLTGLLKTAVPATARGNSAESWAMFGGSPDRSQISTASGHTGARVASIELPHRLAGTGAQVLQVDRRGPVVNMQVNNQNDEETGMTLGIMPVVDRGELFFQDGARVWARSLDSGFPLPGWAATYGAADEQSRGVYQLRTAGVAPANAGMQRGAQYTLTLTDTSVFGVMGQSVRAQGYTDPLGRAPSTFNADTSTRLVCLDRKTGQERWHVSPGTLAGEGLMDDERERLRVLDFSASPVVEGDNVFVIARGGKELQFENCYVICLNAANGQYRWSCLVASSSSMNNAQVPPDFARPPMTASHLAYSGGRLYVNTNLGAVAAIDASTGSVVWLSLYRHSSAAAQRIGINWAQVRADAPAAGSVRPWEYNPVIAENGKLFFMPLDSRYLFVYDASTGNEIKAIDVSEFEFDGVSDQPRALLAVNDGVAVLSGSDRVYLVKWSAYDVEKQFSDNVPQAVIYTSMLPSNRQHDSIRGRAFVTADSVLVTTDMAMAKLGLRKGLKMTDSYPEGAREWDEPEGEGPGNIIASGDYVVIAGARRVNIYTDMTLARAKLDKGVADAPHDVGPRLTYAEVMFAANQTAIALEKLNEAVDMLGGLKQMRPGDQRKKVFDIALNSAEKLAKVKRGEANEAAIKFYDLAAAAADQPHEQVTYRFSRAKFDRENHDAHSLERSIALLQDILSHPDWRTQHFAVDDDSATPGGGTVLDAGVIATQQIAAIKAKHPEAYAAQEKLAGEAMARVQSANDAAQLLAVANVFPNADAAPRAMLAAAGLYEKAGDARQATRVLRQSYRDYAQASEKAQIVEALARNYLRLPGGISVAAARLGRAKPFADTKLTQPLVLPDGKKIENVTFKEAAAALNKLRPAAADDPPMVDLHVPDRVVTPKVNGAPVQAFLPDGDTRNVKISDVTDLLQPDESPPVHVRGDRIVVTMRDNKVALFAPGGTTPIGTSDALSDTPLHAAWMPGGAVVLVWSHNEVVALDGATARTLWAVPVKSFPTSDLNGGTGLEGVEIVTDTPAGETAIVRGQQVIVVNGGVRVVRNFVRGRPVAAPQPELPSTPNGPELVTRVVPLSDRVIVATSSGRVACLKLADGSTLWQTPISTRPIDKVVVNEDFSVARVSEEGAVRLIVLDNFTGQVQGPIHSFPLGSGMIPQNVALSPDGMLVWTTPDRLCGQDLYEPGKALTFEFPNRGMVNGLVPIGGPVGFNGNGRNRRFIANDGNGQWIYNGCTRDSQLLIRGDRIYAVDRGGTFVTVHSLETGELLTHDDDGKQTPSELGTGAGGGMAVAPNSGEVLISLSTAGPYLYILGPRSLMCYNMDRPALDQWRDQSGLSGNPNYQLAAPTKTELLVISEPVSHRENPGDLGVPAKQIRLYDRGQVSDKDHPSPTVESGGSIDYIYTMHDVSGVKTCQPVEGGVYYLTGDQTLHFLAGARP